MNKRERQQKILSLIQARPIGTQEDLRALLNLGLIEIVDARLARPYEPPCRHETARHAPSSYGMLMAA